MKVTGQPQRAGFLTECACDYQPMHELNQLLFGGLLQVVGVTVGGWESASGLRQVDGTGTDWSWLDGSVRGREIGWMDERGIAMARIQVGFKPEAGSVM